MKRTIAILSLSSLLFAASCSRPTADAPAPATPSAQEPKADDQKEQTVKAQSVKAHTLKAEPKNDNAIVPLSPPPSASSPTP
jgi:hypothetical protein